jgi:enamine deaminase RidA (YjgF/YER057c/UK114 family)
MKILAAFTFSVFSLMACAVASAQTDYLKPEGLSPANGYSHVIVAKPGRMVFIAGQVANDHEGKLVGKGDLKAQTVQIFENLKLALAAAGASFDDVVKIGWYVKEYKPEYLPTLRDVRNQYVNSARLPTSALVGVQSLFQPDLLLEVDAIAVVPEKRAAAKKARGSGK